MVILGTMQADFPKVKKPPSLARSDTDPGSLEHLPVTAVSRCSMWKRNMSIIST